MAGNKFRMKKKKESKIKFDKKSKIAFLTETHILIKPSDNKKYYSDLPSIKKNQELNNIEDIIEQKDGKYAKFRKNDNKFYYVKLTDEYGELLIKFIEKLSEKEENKCKKFSYSTVGQIKVGVENESNLSISPESSIEISHNEFIRNSYKLLEKTNCFFLMKQINLPKNLPKDLENSSFHSLIKSIYGIDPINNEKLNLGQRLLSMAEIGGIKSLVNISKIIAKFDENKLKQKIEQQNFLNLVTDFNKNKNDNIKKSKEEIVENLFKELYYEKNEYNN